MKIIVLAVTLCIALALDAPAHADNHAENNFYVLGAKVLVSPPVTTVGPGVASVWLTLPRYGIVSAIVLKSCAVWQGRGHPEWWDGVPTVQDEHVGVHLSDQNLYRAQFQVRIKDTMPGRVQTWCIRLLYYPAPLEYEEHD